MSTNKQAEILQLFEKKHKPRYFLDWSGKQYVQLRLGNLTRTCLIKSSTMKALIIKTAKDNNIGYVSLHQIESVLDVLVSNAYASNEVIQVENRVGRHSDGSIVIDSGGDVFFKLKNGIIEIVDDVDIPFNRPNKMQKIPIPPLDVDLDQFLLAFKKKFNFEDELHYLLALVFVIKALLPNSGAHVIMILSGSQGSGKTTSSNIFKRLIDPSVPFLLSPPKNINDLLSAAQSSLLLGFDNISFISAEMADAFCRIATGGGISKRKLYTDDEESSYDLIKPVLFNGIEELSTRADFLDRAIILPLKKLENSSRKSENSLKEEFEKDYPILIGGILKLLALVDEELPNIRTNDLPRMTEFARTGLAIEKILGLEEDVFLNTYSKNISDKSDTAFWNDEVCVAIFKALTKSSSNRYPLQGTMTEIMEKLRDNHFSSNRPTFQIPPTVKRFSGHLKRIEPLLNSKGIVVVKLPRTATAKSIEIKFKDSNNELQVKEEMNHIKRIQQLENELESANSTVEAYRKGSRSRDIDSL